MASTIKVNTITTESGSTVTLGESGKTIALACGASQTGFGRTGTVDWCTTAKTSPLTAVSGKGYFINTTGGAITVTLPASPTAGDIVSLKDYKDTWATACKAVTLGRNSSKISGECLDATLSTAGQSITMVYVDGTQGWENIQTDTTIVGENFVTATGGAAVVTCGDYKTHIFTGDAAFCVSAVSNTPANNVVDYIVVAGGGGGSMSGPCGGGAGAGGFRYFSQLSPAGSPLVAPAGLTVSATSYPITVGGGGARGSGAGPGVSVGCNGANSIFSSITSAGGGGGGQYPGVAGAAGGSGGGGGTNCAAGGGGNTPPVSPPQGQNGGAGSGAMGPGSNPVHRAGGGGGGAGAAGIAGSTPTAGGDGGVGSYIPDGFIGPTAPSYGTTGPVSNTRYFAGGGGGGAVGANNPIQGCGGAGGGGKGGQGGPAPTINSENGTANTGGGAGGVVSTPTCIGSGGSGIVMIRYKYQ